MSGSKTAPMIAPSPPIPFPAKLPVSWNYIPNLYLFATAASPSRPPSLLRRMFLLRRGPPHLDRGPDGPEQVRVNASVVTKRRFGRGSHRGGAGQRWGSL